MCVHLPPLSITTTLSLRAWFSFTVIGAVPPPHRCMPPCCPPLGNANATRRPSDFDVNLYPEPPQPPRVRRTRRGPWSRWLRPHAGTFNVCEVLRSSYLSSRVRVCCEQASRGYVLYVPSVVRSLCLLVASVFFLCADFLLNYRKSLEGGSCFFFFFAGMDGGVSLCQVGQKNRCPPGSLWHVLPWYCCGTAVVPVRSMSRRRT